MTSTKCTPVRTGIDILAAEGFSRLRGLTVGVVTNQTGLDAAGRETAELLSAAEGVRLAALFSPEHGWHGILDEKIEDSVHAESGLAIYSLYGVNRQPTPEQLHGLDALVFDIQDIGCRFYTYISTLGLLLEAASAAGIPVYILDRPNPLGGVRVDGPIADTEHLSFPAYHTIPLRHGMTVGELALLYYAELGLTGPPPEIVRCEGWRRGDWFDSTGLLWTNPSPNMRSLSSAVLYPGVGVIELTNVSVGRGTDRPFELFGAPYVDPHALAAELNAAKIPGVGFVPIRFRPSASQFAGEDCGGVNIVVRDRSAIDCGLLGMALAVALRRLAEGDWKPEKLMTLLANQWAYDSVLRAEAPAEIALGWREELAEFLARRAPYLLYEEEL